MPLYTEEDVTDALNALVNGEYKSIRKAAIAFQIPFTTLQKRQKNQKSYSESHVSQQLLAPIEETALENRIYRAAKLGAPITLQLVKILASEIQTKRSSKNDENELSPISDRWVDRFRTRHPRIKTCFSRTIDTARSTALDFSTIKSYFDNLGEVLREHKYPPSAIYNVDETGSSIGSSRKSVVLLDRLNQRRENESPTLFSRHHPKQTQSDAPHQELSIDTGLTSLAPKTSELFLLKHTIIPSYLLCKLCTRPGTSAPPQSCAPVLYGRALVLYRQILQKETDTREGFETRTTLRKGTAAGQR
jgi:hypothetical protein